MDPKKHVRRHVTAAYEVPQEYPHTASSVVPCTSDEPNELDKEIVQQIQPIPVASHTKSKADV